MKKIRHFLWIYLLLSSFVALNAQNVPKKLDSLLTRTLDSMRTVLKNKSLSAAIQFPNNVVWSAAKGISAENPLTYVKPNDTYLIGSVTKTITSACILQLVDEKKLRLDDSLFKWVDTFKYINPNITVRQLLRHQSGIYDVLQNPQNQPMMLAKKDSVWSLKNLIKTFIKPANFQPGASWEYSNTNYYLLAMIIEKATGQPYYKELRKRFFTPLGLTSVSIPAFEPLPTNVAHVWIDLNGDGINDDAHAFYTSWKSLNAEAGPCGGYYATASDVSKWMYRYMRGDLITPATMTQAQMTVAGSGLPSGTTYGLGLMSRVFLGLKAFGHGGDLSYSASSWYFPTKDLSISVLNNDSKFTSWTLIPTVTELLRTYTKYEKSLAVSEILQNQTTMTIAPNPFSENTSVSLTLPEVVSEMQIIITNALGEKVISLKQQHLDAGNHPIFIENLSTLPNGLYLMSLVVEGKMIKSTKLLKV
jgi:D-alanyl-D-alanine carboxypeptidase